MATHLRDAIQRTALDNGLRVVTARRPGTPLAAVKLFCKVGSRHDGASAGIAHFLEHLLFSQTATPTARAAFEAIEAAGGEMNAVTTREYTALQAVVLAPQAARVAHLFADLLQAGAFDAAVVERERRIILDEIELYQDSYQVIWDLFLEALWDGHPLARPVTGTRASVAALTQAQLEAHHIRYLAADRLVLAAAGDVDHDVLVRTAEARLGHLRPGGPPEADASVSSGAGRVFLDKDIHQTHLVLGVEGPALSDAGRSPVRLLEIILGHGTRSRLNRTLRTARGLVYDVSSVAMNYADRGYLAVYTACAPENVRAVTMLVLDELEQLRLEGATDTELSAAKTYYEGSLARSFETVLSLASIIGIEELLHRIEPFEASVARVRAVTPAEVREVAAALLAPERYAMAGVGRRLPDA